MADFTVEINRGQSDAVSLSTNKTSPNGLAFTYALEQANIDNETPFTDEPDYLDFLILNMLGSWRKQQLNDGVADAYKAADDTTKLAVRATLGLP